MRSHCMGVIFKLQKPLHRVGHQDRTSSLLVCLQVRLAYPGTAPGADKQKTDEMPSPEKQIFHDEIFQWENAFFLSIRR